MAHQEKKISWLLYRIFNISRTEVWRVTQAWVLHFCFSFAFFLGWTVLLALFIGEFRAEKLPYLYIAYALASVLGAFLYARVVYRATLKKLMIWSVILLLIVLVLAGVWRSHHLFFFGALFVIFGIFVAQINLFLARHRDELFTPLESERVLPLIDTTEPVGGIVAGVVVLTFIEHLHTDVFLAVFGASFVVLLALFLLFERLKGGIPRLHDKDEEMPTNHILTLRRGMEHIKAIPFMRNMAFLVLFWVISLNLVDNLYSRTIEHMVLLSENGGHEEVVKQEPIVPLSHASQPVTEHVAEQEAPAHPAATATEAKPHGSGLNDLLTERLGAFQILFSSLILLMQLLLSSRIVRRLGVIKSFLLMPATTIVTTLGGMLYGGIYFPFGMKGTMETLGVVHKTAYLNSYYSLSENMREYIRQLLEGIVRPIGILVSTAAILLLQWLLPAQIIVTMHLLILLSLVIMLLIIRRLPQDYTAILKKNLASSDHVLKNNAIEILSQKSSQDAAEILSKSLIYRTESPVVKMKILKALGEIKDPNSLPEILQCLQDVHIEVQVEACHALAQFHELGKQVFHQAFSKHKIVTTLTDMFIHQNHKQLRSAIIKVFAQMQHADIAPMLLKILEEAKDEEIIAHTIAIMGMFDDINIWHYIAPYLSSNNPHIKGNVIIALWKYKKYRLQLLIHLISLLESKEKELTLSGLFVVGEIKATQELPRLVKFLKQNDLDFVRHAAIAMLKMEQMQAVPVLMRLLLEEDETTAHKTLMMLHGLQSHVAQALHRLLRIEVSQHLHYLISMHQISLHELEHVEPRHLTKLLRWYTILGEDREVFHIKQLLAEQVEKKAAL